MEADPLFIASGKLAFGLGGIHPQRGSEFEFHFGKMKLELAKIKPELQSRLVPEPKTVMFRSALHDEALRSFEHKPNGKPEPQSAILELLFGS